MRTTSYLRPIVALVCTLAALPGLASAQGDAPSVVVIPPDLQNNLLGTHKQAIRERVDYWRQRIIQATTDTDVQLACRRMVGDYELYETRAYRSFVADYTAQQLMGVLNGKDLPDGDPVKLKLVKRINTGLALGEMPETAMQTAMEYMIAAKNAGLRYVGWDGYAGVGAAVLASGDKKKIDTFVQSWSKSAANEVSPLVLRKVMIALAAAAKAPAEQQKALISALLAAWPARQKQIAAGGLGVLEAMGNAAAPLSAIAKDMTNDPAGRASALQSIVNVMGTAGYVYGGLYQAYVQLSQADPSEETDEQLLKVNRDLAIADDVLRKCETALVAGSGKEAAYAVDAMSNPAPAAAVMEAAVFTWPDALKPLGVKTPTMPNQ